MKTCAVILVCAVAVMAELEKKLFKALIQTTDESCNLWTVYIYQRSWVNELVWLWTATTWTSWKEQLSCHGVSGREIKIASFISWKVVKPRMHHSSLATLKCSKVVVMDTETVNEHNLLKILWVYWIKHLFLLHLIEEISFVVNDENKHWQLVSHRLSVCQNVSEWGSDCLMKTPMRTSAGGLKTCTQ